MSHDPENDCVFVNGIKANYTDELGNWEADNVPVSASGTAALKLEVYDRKGVSPLD